MSLAVRINDFRTGLFMGVGIQLVDFKIEVGRLYEGDLMRVVLADEISPDNCRLWDIKTRNKMDKDRFRENLGGLIENYREVAQRLGILVENDNALTTGPAPRSVNPGDRHEGARHRHAQDRCARSPGPGHRRSAFGPRLRRR